MQTDDQIQVIKSRKAYAIALMRLEGLMGKQLKRGSQDLRDFELLSLVIQDYEATIGSPMPDPVDAIKFRMEQQWLKQKDLVPYIGSAPKVSEVLNGKRRLSLTMIRLLSKKLGIPADSLIWPSRYERRHG